MGGGEGEEKEQGKQKQMFRIDETKSARCYLLGFSSLDSWEDSL